MRYVVLALEGVFDTGLSVLLDTFTTANELAAMLMVEGPQFELSVVGMTRRVRTGHGMSVPVMPARPDMRPDWVIVPALNTKMPVPLVESLGRADMIRAKAQIRAWHSEGASVAASCIGTFLLAETGLLDGKDATTTWWLEQYPSGMNQVGFSNRLGSDS